MSVVLISNFTKKVLIHIKSIPAGRVATYKQIAELAGRPQGSRGVAWILHTCSTPYKLPWHRVLNSQGKISFDKQSHNFKQQKARLIREGVEVSADGALSLSRFQWSKKPRKKPATKSGSKKKSTPKMFG